MLIVKHLNNFVYFIKKKFKGSNSFCKVRRWVNSIQLFLLNLLTNINQVALSISERLCRQTQECSSFECGVVGAVLVTLQPL